MDPKVVNIRLIVAALQEAKKHLWDGKGRCPDDKELCVCWSISKGASHGKTSFDAADAAVNHVMSLIPTWAFASSWLHNELGVERGTIPLEDVQAWRLLWIDHMIQELSK